jgi:hypothetical protein
MAAFQVERLWILKALGSDGYLDFLRTAAARSSQRFAVACNLIAGGLVAGGAAALWLVNPDPGHDWGFWFAAGLALYAIINAYDRSRATSRLFVARGSARAI